MLTFITVSPTDIRKTCSKFTFKIFHLEKSNYFQLFRIKPSGHISSRFFFILPKVIAFPFVIQNWLKGIIVQ